MPCLTSQRDDEGIGGLLKCLWRVDEELCFSELLHAIDAADQKRVDALPLKASAPFDGPGKRVP